MRYLLFIILLSIFVSGKTQNKPEFSEGTVTYITSQNVYVKFGSTKNISEGDTLYRKSEGNFIPTLIVKSLSSVSCVCAIIPTSSYLPAVSDVFISKKTSADNNKNEGAPAQTTIIVPVLPKSDSIKTITDTTGIKQQKKKPSIDGSMSAQMNTTFSGENDYSGMRLKYGLNFNARNLANGKLNIETYFSVIYKDNKWKSEQSNLFNYLKIYNFSANYAINKNSTLWFGRKINHRLGSMGAVDGIQYEVKTGQFYTGVLVGSRPDYNDYGIDFSLFQYGVYLAHDKKIRKGNTQSTLAFINQNNSGKTDRRYFYLQHFNTIVKNLYFFASFEIDVYNKTLNTSDTTYTQDNSPTLTNLNTSLRYRFTRQLNASVSYSSRKNVIYYESYKSYLDRLIDSDHLHGYSAQINYSPVRKISIGVNGAYRYQNSDPNPTSNLYTYFTYNLLPVIGWSTTISATILKTAYLKGDIYSIGFNGDILKGKLSGGINYRYVKYDYSELVTKQNIGELNLLWRIYKRLTLSAYYEGCYASSNDYNRIYLQMRLGF